MVFHIPGADVADFAFELIKQIDRVFTQYIDQHVKSAAVRHTNTYFLRTVTTDSLNRLSHHRDEAFATFKTESFGARILRAQRTLQTFRAIELAQNIQSLFDRKVWRAANSLHAVHNPMTFFGVHDMHELRTHSAAISSR